MENNSFRNKIFAISILIILLLVSFNVNAINSKNENNINTLSKEELLIISDLLYETKENYIKINLDETEQFLTMAGKPMLPVITKTYNFPLETKIKSVECLLSNIKIINITKKILPASQPVQLTPNDKKPDNIINENIEDYSVYSNSNIFPKESYNYTISCGLINEKPATFVTIKCYPVRYSPSNNKIFYSNNIEIKINYEENIKESSQPDEYDLVIIAPKKFKLALQPLVLHKNLNGIKTKIKTTESIYTDSFLGKYDARGRDNPEKIKYFIKYAIENWGISYVLLAGGHQNQRYSWHVPVRYSNLHDRSYWNDTYVTDLYYSDIYRYNETSQSHEFDDWDSNGNGIIGEWTWIWDPERLWWYDLDKKDVLDLYPDVYIGRLACRDKAEVRTMVNKIINYEKKTYNSTWFKKMILVGGDTVPYGDGYCEGEVENELAASYLEPLGFQFNRLWVSNGELTDYNSVKNAIQEGAGFIYLSGHGTPAEWCTHPEEDPDTWIDVYSFQMKNIRNKNKLPICVVGGCHNNQFDVTILNLITGVIKNGFQYFQWNEGIDCFGKFAWMPECWSWNLVSQKNGGFIAAIGNTGLGWGVGGSNCVNHKDGFITTHFFQIYSELSLENNPTLGMTHGETINDYIEIFEPNSDLLDRKTVEEWTLLGDPTLRIGGYE